MEFKISDFLQHNKSKIDKIQKMEFESVKAGLADKSLVLIDVRNPDELEKHGKIPGSINIPCKLFYKCCICYTQI